MDVTLDGFKSRMHRSQPESEFFQSNRTNEWMLMRVQTTCRKKILNTERKKNFKNDFPINSRMARGLVLFRWCPIQSIVQLNKWQMIILTGNGGGGKLVFTLHNEIKLNISNLKAKVPSFPPFTSLIRWLKFQANEPFGDAWTIWRYSVLGAHHEIKWKRAVWGRTANRRRSKAKGSKDSFPKGSFLKILDFFRVDSNRARVVSFKEKSMQTTGQKLQISHRAILISNQFQGRVSRISQWILEVNKLSLSSGYKQNPVHSPRIVQDLIKLSGTWCAYLSKTVRGITRT